MVCHIAARECVYTVVADDDVNGFTSTRCSQVMPPLMLAAPLRATVVVSKRHTTERFARSRCVVRLSAIAFHMSGPSTGGRWTRHTTTRCAGCGQN